MTVRPPRIPKCSSTELTGLRIVSRFFQRHDGKKLARNFSADKGGPFPEKLPVAPAMSVRNPLGRAEAQVAQLTNDLADLRREFDAALFH